MTGSLHRLLDPASVAVLGAKDAPGNRGGTAVRMLRKFGYAGEIYPVHPAADAVDGVRGYPSIADLPAVPDVAVIGVGAARVPGVLPELAAAGVGAAIVWAGGFAETGAEGAALQQEVAGQVREHSLRLLGPNCLGVVNSASAFTGTFAYWLSRTDALLPGVISMVSQSGGLAASAHSWAQAAGVGFRYMVSTGNEVDVSAVEVLEHFVDDPDSRVLCCYLEGVTDGAELLRVLDRARAAGKPVVVLKGGRSDASAAAVAAHTGALAGAGRVWEAMLDGTGAIRVFSVEELVEVVSYLAGTVGREPLRGNRVAVLSYGGGQGVLAADQCAEAGLRVPRLSDATVARLRPLAPEIASLRNPLDLTPEAFNQPRWRAAFPALLRALADSGEVDTVLCQLGGMAAGAAETAAAVRELHDSGPLPIAVQSRAYPAEAREIFDAAGIHVFHEQPRAVTTLGRLAAGVADVDQSVVDAARSLAVQEKAPELPTVVDGQVLAEHEVHALLGAAGVRVLRGGTAHSPAEAAAIAEDIAGPVALKVVSERITHRAKAGLLALGVAPGQAAAAHERLHRRAVELDAAPLGIFVTEMHAGGGAELLVSAFRDETFGPVLSFGAGGGAAEQIDDVTFAAATGLDEPAALAALRRLRTPGLATAAAVAFLVRFAALAAGLPWARYVLELNPVAVTGTDAVPLDGLLIVERVG